MPDNDEKRRFLREQAAFPLVYSIKAPVSAVNEFGAGEHNAIASNLCEEGLRFFTDFDLPVGVVLVLKFWLSTPSSPSLDEHSHKIELEAEVRHCAQTMVKTSFLAGAHFMHLSDRDRAFINAAMAG